MFLPQISRQQAQHTPGPTFTLASSSQIFIYTQLPRPPLWLIPLAHASLRFPETTSLGCGIPLSTDRDEVPRSRVTKRRKVGERESNPAYGPRVAYLESVQELPLGVNDYDSTASSRGFDSTVRSGVQLALLTDLTMSLYDLLY